MPLAARFLAPTALALLALATPSPARADDKAECIAASEKAQQLRDDRKLLKAREQLLTCGRDVCPGPVRKDCADMLQQIDKRTPSVVLRAKDKNGQDLVTVKVTSDGAPFTDKLDGRAISLDPGDHTFRFEAEGNPPLEQTIVIAEGEQNRVVAIQLGGGAGAPAEPTKKGAPVGAFVLGGVGVISAAVAPIFYVMGLSEKSDIEKGVQTCTTPTCDSEKGDIRAKLAVGDVFMGVGILAVAGGIVWAIVHYTSGNHESPPAAAAFDVAPTAYGRGAVASATLRF